MARKLVNDRNNGMHVTIDNVPELMAALRALTRDEVLVGVPGETTDRPATAGGVGGAPPEEITNATLAYIHDNGAPEAKIPARPFMIPGIEAVQSSVTELLAKTAQYALQGQSAKIDEGFSRVGMACVKSIQNVINGGIAPALAERTLRERAAKGRKGAQFELDRRAKGLQPSLEYAIPLKDTNEMLKSISYVVRARASRSK